MTEVKISRIQREGKYRRALRNTNLVWIEIEHRTIGTCEGHQVRCDFDKDQKPVDTIQHLEVYADRVRAVVNDKLRTPAHLAKHDQAVAMCDNIREQWMQEHSKAMRGMDHEERLEYVRMNLNQEPGHYHRMVGLPHGLPPYTQVNVIHPDDVGMNGTARRMPATEWLKLGREEQKDWTMPAPDTGDNANDRAAQVIADALARVAEKTAEPKPKRRGRPPKDSSED